MKLKNLAARGSKMALKGEVKVIGDDGILEVEDAGLCAALVAQGWQAVDKKAKEASAPKKNEEAPKPVDAPAFEEPKKESKKEEAKAEDPKPKKKEEPKKESKKDSIKKERPKFRRGE